MQTSLCAYAEYLDIQIMKSGFLCLRKDTTSVGRIVARDFTQTKIIDFAHNNSREILRFHFQFPRTFLFRYALLYEQFV